MSALKALNVGQGERKSLGSATVLPGDEHVRFAALYDFCDEHTSGSADILIER